MRDIPAQSRIEAQERDLTDPGMPNGTFPDKMHPRAERERYGFRGADSSGYDSISAAGNPLEVVLPPKLPGRKTGIREGRVIVLALTRELLDLNDHSEKTRSPNERAASKESI
jgi:hypothetical protein